MVDTNIALQGRALDTATPIRQAQQDESNNALAAEQTLKAHYENMSERDKQRLQSTVVGAAQLKTYLDKGDAEGAHEFLVKRQALLHQRMGMGENIDTQETDYALQKLRTGDLEGLKNDVNSIMAAGQVYGIINHADAPANVQEWQYYSSLPEDQRRQYLEMKRSNQVVNQGSQQTIVGPTGQPVAFYPVSPKIEDTPEYRRQVQEAEMQGRGETPENVKAAKGKENVQLVTDSIRGNLELLRKSGGIVDPKKGAASNVSAYLKGTAVGQLGGNVIGSKEQSIRNQIKSQRPALINAIRAATNMSAKAMDSNTELQFYLQQVDGQDIEASKAALDMIDKLYGLGSSSQQPQANGGMVKISNGKETYLVTPEDAAAAAQEGFKQVQ